MELWLVCIPHIPLLTWCSIQTLQTSSKTTNAYGKKKWNVIKNINPSNNYNLYFIISLSLSLSLSPDTVNI